MCFIDDLHHLRQATRCIGCPARLSPTAALLRFRPPPVARCPPSPTRLTPAGRRPAAPSRSAPTPCAAGGSTRRPAACGLRAHLFAWSSLRRAVATRHILLSVTHYISRPSLLIGTATLSLCSNCNQQTRELEITSALRAPCAHSVV